MAGKAERTARANQLDINVGIVVVFASPSIGNLVAVRREDGMKFLTGRTREGHDVRVVLTESGSLGSIEPRGRATEDDQSRQRSPGGPPSGVRRPSRAGGERCDEGSYCGEPVGWRFRECFGNGSFHCW